MSRAAVICEFNPFHNGHKFMLEKIKERYADEIVCVMSGSFVQRGDIAITDKFSRAYAALDNGADMVVELPTVYAMSSAAVFAENGVRLARELGCDKLCFGAESQLNELIKALAVIDSSAAQERIAARMRAGAYYPRALSESINEKYRDLVSMPNNILALEYIRACAEFGIEPIALPRVGVGHDSDLISGNIASATKIREMIKSENSYDRFTPMSIERPAYIEAVESAVLYRLKTMTAEELSGIADVSEGLENRIVAVADKYNSLSEILENLKTKRYTMSRLRRILLSAALGITRDMQKSPVPYIRVLGVKEDKKDLIASRGLPIIADVKRGYDGLEGHAKEVFDVDIRASQMMNIATGVAKNEFSTGMILFRDV